MVVAACAGPSEPTGPASHRPAPPRSIDELQRLSRTPRACDRAADCPSGSYCDGATDRCRWDCYADSDCHAGQVCSAEGACVAGSAPIARALVGGAPQLATTAPGCAAVPVADRLAALAELELSPQVCFDDASCPCGAYCANDATCRFDCYVDDAATPPFCSPGETCSTEGRCVLPTHADDPTAIVELAAAPSVVRGDTATSPVVIPVSVSLRARTLAVVAQATSAPVRLAPERSLAPGAEPPPRVRCAATDSFAASCELGAGWVFGAGGDPLAAAPRTIWIELPQRATAAEWTVTARSEWSDAPVGIAVVAAPVIEPPTEDGHYTGTLSWPQPGGAPIELPIEAEVGPTRIALFDPTRILLPSGVGVLSRDSSLVTHYAWLRSDHASMGPQSTGAQLAVARWEFSPTTASATGQLTLSLGAGAPITLGVTARRAGPTTLPGCNQAQPCDATAFCERTLGRCLPGPALTGLGPPLPLSAELFSAQSGAWSSPLAALRSAAPDVDGKAIIGMERASCSAVPALSGPGRFGSANPTPSADVVCADDTPQQVFPYADRTSAVTVSGGVETFHLLDACLSELAIEPTSPYTAANLLQPRQCVSVARFLLAMTAPSEHNHPQLAMFQQRNQLLRQWVTLHAMIARTAAQQTEYEEAIDNHSATPANERLGAVVDLFERGWRQVLRRRFPEHAAVEVAAEKAPDPRALGRPLAHWTFNQPVDGPLADTESGRVLQIAGVLPAQRGFQYLTLSKSTAVSCATTADVALPARHFSLAAYLGIAGTSAAYTLFDKASASDYFAVQVAGSGTAPRAVTVSSGIIVAGGVRVRQAFATFSVPAEFGFYALVADGSELRLVAARRATDGTPIVQTFTSWSDTGPTWGQPGKVKLGCAPTQGNIILDELSLWDRPIATETVKVFATRYIAANGGMTPAVDTLGASSLSRGGSDEQTQALPVHLLDAAAAHMQLLAAYVRTERAALYAECGTGVTGAARTRVIDRVGRALRFAALIEGDARDRLAQAAEAADAWRARFDAVSTLLAGRRAAVVAELGLATRCENPLGISDDDLPLFHGEEVGESARFFASTRFLSQQAHNQIIAATGELEAARAAWQQQRVSGFQNGVLAPAEKAERIHKIETEYEGALRRLCGTPTTGRLLDGFRNHTITSRNCFLKLDAPGCALAEALPVKDVPAACLRGVIGEQVMAIQGAELDARNADNAYDRAIDQYDSEVGYCTRVEEFHEETQAIAQAHVEEMIKLRAARRAAARRGLFRKAFVGMALGALAGNPGLALGSVMEVVGFDFGSAERQAAEDEQQAEEAHQLVMAARANALQVMACFHGADDQKFRIDAARDVLLRADLSAQAAALQLDNLQDEVRSILDQVAGDVGLEQAMVRVLPHHHYWLDDHIAAYRHKVRYAQRLTYLALRAFEYESQQSLGLGGAVLAARTPAALEQVVDLLDQRTAPMQGELGFVIGDFAPVLSVRDDILRLGTPQAAPGVGPPVAPGFPIQTPTEALRAYLRSDASKIYANGQYLGRGLRFAIRPSAWSQYSCAERIWRLTAALQVDGSPVNNAQLVLWQENAFGSQTCRASTPGELHIARVRPNHNLLVDEGGNLDHTPFQTAQQYTAMLMTGLGNRSREELGALPEGLHSGLAGRGVFANYILLFPSAQFDPLLDTIKDVLLRFDLVEVTNISGNPSP